MRLEFFEVQGNGMYNSAHANTNLSNILMLTYATINHANAHDGNHEPNLYFTEGYDNNALNRVNNNNESFVITVMLKII